MENTLREIWKIHIIWIREMAIYILKEFKIFTYIFKQLIMVTNLTVFVSMNCIPALLNMINPRIPFVIIHPYSLQEELTKLLETENVRIN